MACRAQLHCRSRQYTDLRDSGRLDTRDRWAGVWVEAERHTRRLQTSQTSESFQDSGFRCVVLLSTVHSRIRLLRLVFCACVTFCARPPACTAPCAGVSAPRSRVSIADAQRASLSLSRAAAGPGGLGDVDRRDLCISLATEAPLSTTSLNCALYLYRRTRYSTLPLSRLEN